VEKTSKMQNSAKPPSALKLDGDNAAEWNFFVQKLKIHLQATKEKKKQRSTRGRLYLTALEIRP
jgi:hypothetical protein